ncbi:MAG: hypothetical protein GQ557_01470 [Mycoplasmataceae bacterium]|nr:hypothetical protein [Mycoplasmataceae bacterium]
MNGYFIEGEYYEYDIKKTNGTSYKNPIKIRCKPNDAGTQGVSSGGKSIVMAQDIQGRPVTKYQFTIKVYDNLPYKPRDNFKILQENKTYTIVNVFEDYQTTNSLANLQFKNMRDNKTFVLVLGEK